MSKFGISAFKETIARGGGASTNHLFRFSVVLPPDINVPTELAKDVGFLCKSVTLPDESVPSVALHHYGREVPIPGIRKESSVSFTFWNLANYTSREFFTQWLGLISTRSDENSRGVQEFSSGALSHSNHKGHLDYVATVTLTHYDRKSKNNAFLQGLPVIGQFFDSGEVTELAKYTFHDAFPTKAGGMAFSSDQMDYQTYDVMFSYRFMTVTLPTGHIGSSVTTNEVLTAKDIYGILGTPGALINLPSASK